MSDHHSIDPDYDACPDCEGRGFLYAPVNSGYVPCPTCKPRPTRTVLVFKGEEHELTTQPKRR